MPIITINLVLMFLALIIGDAIAKGQPKPQPKPTTTNHKE